MNAVKTEIEKVRAEHLRSIKDVMSYVAASTTELRELIEITTFKRPEALPEAGAGKRRFSKSQSSKRRQSREYSAIEQARVEAEGEPTGTSCHDS